MARTMPFRISRIYFRAVGAALILACAALSPLCAQDLRFFRIGTGAPGGTYHPVGGVISNAISNPPGSPPCDEGGSCGVPGFIASAKSTQGSIDNVKAIGTGALESGFSQADIAYWAFRGTGPLAATGAITNLRAIANLFSESVHVVARRGAGIDEISDLRGKRISLGEEGSGTVVEAWAILDAFGLDKGDFSVSYLKPVPASIQLREGKIDAFFIVAGAPIGAVQELSRSLEITVIPIMGPKADALVKSFPFFDGGVIPGGVYEGVDETRTISVGAQWLVAAETDADLVYGITRAFWHERTGQLLAGAHRMGKDIRLASALDGIAVPLHPGAARYYFEVGRLSGTSSPPAAEKQP